ncbi:MAG: response regulator, partial [Anaerolineae bacterium]
ALYWIRRSDPFDMAIIDLELIDDIDQDFLTAIGAGGGDGSLMFPLLLLAESDPEPRLEIAIAGRISSQMPPSQLNNILSQLFAHSDQLTSPTDAAAPGNIVSIDLNAETPMAARHPLHILLAEDNRVNQKVATRILEKLGYVPDVANNGRQAVTMLEYQPYDVILMDIQMPEMDGVAAAQHIRAHWLPDKQPHIIAMTAHALAGDREYYLANGMDDYVSKPIQIEKLVTALYQVKAQPRPAPQPVPQTTPDSSINKPHPAPTTANHPVEPNGVIDMAFLKELLGPGAAEMLTELLPLYLDDGEKLVKKMMKAIDEEDGRTLKQAAHTLKGSSASLGIKKLANLSKQMESADDTEDFAEAVALFTEIEKEFAKVQVMANALAETYEV